jgi:hypothetical protein
MLAAPGDSDPGAPVGGVPAGFSRDRSREALEQAIIGKAAALLQYRPSIQAAPPGQGGPAAPGSLTHSSAQPGTPGQLASAGDGVQLEIAGRGDSRSRFADGECECGLRPRLAEAGARLIWVGVGVGRAWFWLGFGVGRQLA